MLLLLQIGHWALLKVVPLGSLLLLNLLLLLLI
jgi:hypothetical protein